MDLPWLKRQFVCFQPTATDVLVNIINTASPRVISRTKYFRFTQRLLRDHYSDVTMGAIASKITSLTIVYSTVYSDADQRKHQSSASLAFVRGIHRWPVNSPRKWPVTWKMFPFDDVIMYLGCWLGANYWTDTYLELGRHRVVKRQFVTRSTISIW